MARTKTVPRQGNCLRANERECVRLAPVKESLGPEGQGFC